MDIETFNCLNPGDQVVITKSGKIYVVERVKTRAENEAYLLDIGTLEMNKAWLARTHEGGRNEVGFRQLRANSKGEVVLYGPSWMRLKPENIQLGYRAPAKPDQEVTHALQ